MSDVHDTPPAGKGTLPSSAVPPALRWDDPAERRRWLVDLREQIHDALAAGEDTARRPRRRFFSRAEVRRRIRAAKAAITSLLAAAERGLDANATG